MRKDEYTVSRSQYLLLVGLAAAGVATLCWALASLLLQPVGPERISYSNSASQEHRLLSRSSKDEPLLEALCQSCRLLEERHAGSGSIANTRGTVSGDDRGSASTTSPNAAGDAKFRGSDGSDQYFAMVLVVKNSQDDIREWVAHHKAVGAGTVYIYDSASEPPLKDLLADYITAGFVVYHYFVPDFGDGQVKRRPQMEMWIKAIKDYRSKHQFIGFLDADEFLIPNGGYTTVPQLLRRLQSFEPIGGLVANWVVFGSSGHKSRPRGGVLQAYTKCLPLRNSWGIHVKSIVNTDFVLKPRDPHSFNYMAGKYAVTEHFQRLDGPTVGDMRGTPSVDYIGVYHYFTKSMKEFKTKIHIGTGQGNHKAWKHFESVNNQSSQDCFGATKYLYM